MASSADTGATEPRAHDLHGRQGPGHEPQTHGPAEEQHRDHRPGRDAGPEERRLGAVGRAHAEGQEDVEAQPGRRERGRHEPRTAVPPAGASRPSTMTTISTGKASSRGAGTAATAAPARPGRSRRQPR